jgi:hypothetical protein
MEAYEAETTEIVTSFLQHEINFPECIEGLNAAFARFVPKMTGGTGARVR